MEKPKAKWIQKAAASIFKNTRQFYKDYPTASCQADIEEEIDNFYKNRFKKQVKDGKT